MKAESYKNIAIKFAKDVTSGIKQEGADIVNACQRFLDDMQREDLELRTKEADAACKIMEGFFVHQKGEDLEGNPLQGQPFTLQPWQVFVVYNLLGFFYTNSVERRYKEAFIMVARKNGKTSFVAALAFAVAVIQRRSGSTVYIVAAALKQALQAFDFILFSLNYRNIAKEFRVLNNSFNHSISYTFTDAEGKPDGTIEIVALASNPDSQDSFNCNFAIADEVAAYKKPAQYNRFKEAMKAYRNKLMVGITTAGDNANSFGFRRMDYAVKIADGTIKDDSFFSFVARADQDEKGEVDYTNPVQHEKANLSYGVTVSPKELIEESLQAQNDPQQRKDFLSRSLNVYTTAMRTYFDVDEFRTSDEKYNWTIDQLAKLNINWYGGADLSRMFDLTAAALYGNYNGVDIVITHGFFPVTMAARKAEEDAIPLYGWKDDGNLTLCNSPTVNAADVVEWFKKMRKKGFKIKQVGYDRKFAAEFWTEMRGAHFNVVDQPQLYYIKSQGFRHIEKAAKDGNLYYLHSNAYEYCVSNVHAVEKTNDMVQYSKAQPNYRIDLFDASVMACVKYIENTAKQEVAKGWWGN